LLPTLLPAQESKKVSIGGTLSVDFGRHYDRFEFTPTISKKILPKLYIGAGPSLSYYSQTAYIYQYNKETNTSVELKAKSNMRYLGGTLYTRFYPRETAENFTQNVFLQTRYEYLRGKGTYRNSDVKFNHTTNNNTFFTGLGYKHALGKKSKIYFLLSFKLNEEKYSPYKNPIIQIGFDF